MIRTAGHSRPHLRHDPRHLLHRPRGAVAIRPPQLRGQQEVPREDVERQVAVRPVVAVEEAPLLLPVQRVVGRVEVEHDLGRRRRMRGEERRRRRRRSIAAAS